MTSGKAFIGDQPRPASPGGAVWGRLVDAAGLGGLVAALLLWYAASAAMGPILPMPHRVVANALGNLLSSTQLPGIGLPRGGYLPHLLYTAYNVLLGGAIGVIVGVSFGLASARSRIVAELSAPLVALLGTTPIVILAPFFLMWFGLSGVAQVALVAIYTATVLHLFSFRGARNLSPAFYDYAAVLGARPRTLLFHVALPGALPEIFGGLRIAMAAAWGLAAVTEMLGGQYGSGRVLVALRSVYDLTGIMAVVLLLSVMAMLVDGLILAARSWMLRWAATSAGAEAAP